MDAESEAYILDACQDPAFGRSIQSATDKEAAPFWDRPFGLTSWTSTACPPCRHALHDTHHPKHGNGFRLGTGFYLSDLAAEVRAYHLRHAPKDHDAWMPDFDTPKALRQARRSAGPNDPMDWPEATVRVHPVYPIAGRHPTRLHHQRTRPAPRGHPGHGIGQGDVAGKSWAIVWPGSATICTPGWHGATTGKTCLCHELRGAPQLGLVDMRTDEVVTRELFKVDQVLGMSFAPNGRDMLFSALEDGQSDLYRYDVVANNQRPLWRDRFDDLHPAFWSEGNTFIFASNRPDDTLRNDRLDHPFPHALDLYVANLDDDPVTLTRWTHPYWVDERHPQPLAKGEFTYLRNAEGLDTRLGMGWLDSTIVAVDTVVRYRTFTQLRDALVLPVPATCVHVHNNEAWVMAPRAGQTNVVSLDLPDPTRRSCTSSPSPVHPEANDLPYPSTVPDWSRDWNRHRLPQLRL